MSASAEDREREPFRWCVYCDADCEASEPAHAQDCPSITGVFVVRAEDCGPVCTHCGERAHGGFQCMTCSTPLVVGDRYMRRVLTPGDPLLPGIQGAEVAEVVCVGCAAQDAIEGVR